MTALAQGMAGLALVMGFALLCIQQLGAASILLAVQSAATAASAIVLHQPMMAIPPVLLAGGIWFVTDRIAAEPRTAPVGGAKVGLAVGGVLAVLSQSQAGLALPLAVVLLSILLAATRRQPWMHIVALVGIQNGILLAACMQATPGLLLPLACLVLPVPLVVTLLFPMLTPHAVRAARWWGWIDLTVSLMVLAATLLVPLDPLASVFAPLLGLDGVLRAWRRRRRVAMALQGRGLALLTTILFVVAVCPVDGIIAWLAVVAAIMTTLQPTLPRRSDDALLAFVGAGLALFGLLLLTWDRSIVGCFSLFAGFAMIGAVIPDLAVVLVILLLRLANQAPWPPAAAALGIGIAIIALLACGWMLLMVRGRPVVALLQLNQVSVAALSLFLGQADGRFAALILLILLLLTRTAARVTEEPAATIAVVGLGGVSPIGVFPGLVLVILALTNHHAWLLLPVGAAFIPLLRASLPRRIPEFRFRPAIPSIGWFPLFLALSFGYFAPDGFVRWCHVLTAGNG